MVFSTPLEGEELQVTVKSEEHVPMVSKMYGPYLSEFGAKFDEYVAGEIAIGDKDPFIYSRRNIRSELNHFIT